MKVLITGADGQLGRALVRSAPPEFTVIALPRTQLDITKHAQLDTVLRELSPDVVINTAAYTAVDRAESDRNNAFNVNAVAVEALARCCRFTQSRLIHISTDYVFDGKTSQAYEPYAPTNPLSVYGASKAAGEQAIMHVEGLNWTTVRTSWLYAPWNQNFVVTMLKLMRERGGVSVVRDQIGSPCSALTLSEFLWRLVVLPDVTGLLHYADAGVTSRYDFAIAIAEEALACGLLQRAAEVKPIATADYPAPAARPAFSVLATKSSVERVAFAQPPWRAALREVLEAISQ